MCPSRDPRPILPKWLGTVGMVLLYLGVIGIALWYWLFPSLVLPAVPYGIGPQVRMMGFYALALAIVVGFVLWFGAQPKP